MLPVDDCPDRVGGLPRRVGRALPLREHGMPHCPNQFVGLVLAVLTAAAAPPTILARPAPSVSHSLVSVQRGQTLEVSVDGSNLADVATTGMNEPQGLEATLVKSEQAADDRATLKLVAAPDATPGEREVRLISPAGVSNPLRVVVEQFPLLAEAEPNDRPVQAQSAVLPAVLVGTIQAAGDADCFRFEARKGQRLVFDVAAARTGTALDATIALYDPSGKEVAAANDTHGADPFLAVDLPADGAYTLEVRDLQYRGGDNYGYRIQAGPIPYVEALLPMTSQRGRAVEVRAVGHNLHGGEKIRLDLTYAQAGRVKVRAATPVGVSNPLPFEITDVPPAIEAEPNNAADGANPVALPAEISGRIDRGDDEDFYRFTLPQKQMVNLEVKARRLGSPVDALLTLRHARSGAVIEANDDAAGADARITRELDAGDYLVSVRDLVYSGGAGHAYRLTVEPTAAPPQEFDVRFQPDAIRLHRGGHALVWCDVTRTNGYTGDVTVTLEGLPRGVTAPPVTLGERTSGLFTISAAPDANLGSGPIRLRASGLVGGTFVSHDGRAELDGRPVQEAYLTVLEAAPFSVGTLVNLDPQGVRRYAGEIASLSARLAGPDPQLEARQADWERQVVAASPWTTLEVTSAQSTGGATLAILPDGSVLASGTNPAADTLTVIAQTDVKDVRAVRLELLTDPSLPSQGPGRAPNGNFVLTRFLVTAAPKASPAAATKVDLVRARATFEQGGYPARDAVDSGDRSGWAISPRTGRPQTATFFPESPVGGDGGTVFKFLLDHQFGRQHVVGKFRLSVNPDADAADVPVVPQPILEVVRTPADKRSPEQKAQLAGYYRGIDPQAASDRLRLEALRTLIAPQAEAARLEEVLAAQTPQLDAERAQWERRVLAGGSWVLLQVVDVKSEAGATLSKEADGSFSVADTNAATDTYRVTAAGPLRGITAVRLEALTDPRLPQNGPGRSDNGNFALTRFAMAHAAKANPEQAVPVELHRPRASAEQSGWGAEGLLDERADTGWAINGYAGRPAAVTFETRTVVPGGDDTLLTFTLEHASQFPKHGIGRFRLWATNALDPHDAPEVPERILALLRSPNLGDAEKAELAAYHRSIAPSLEPVRRRLAELRAAVAAGRPAAAARNQSGSIPVLINRRDGFAGDVSVTLQGFTTGREGNGPRPAERSLRLTPLSVTGPATFGTLAFQVDGGAEPGTRMAVLRAEAKVGGHTVVTYSPAFPFTVN